MEPPPPPLRTSRLQHLIQVTPSGINHPYYGVSPSEVMRATAICYPPLGYETTVPSGDDAVTFTVAVQAEDADVEKLQVQIWHNFSHHDEWEALPLELMIGTYHETSIPSNSKATPMKWFSGVLKGSPESTHTRHVSFTVRFKTRTEDNWKWIRDAAGPEDGRLLYQTYARTLNKPDELSSYLGDISPDLKVERVSSDTPNTKVWTVTGKVTPAHEESSGYSDHVLGLPYDYLRWFALIRLWSPWLAPRQGRGAELAEKDALLYWFLRKDGTHLCVLAISGIDDVLSIFHHKDGRLIINSRNDQATEGVARVVVAVGDTFEEANAAVIYRARHIVEPFVQLDRLSQAAAKDADKLDKVHASWVQDWYDGFTYCTWNGLGQALTQEKIMTALESLEAHGVTITNLIIDDNWQSLDNEGQNQMVRGMTRFEANSEGFPRGLKYAISEIRTKYPSIKHVAVWHALLGYWGGISQTGSLAKDYKTLQVRKRDGVIGGTMTVIDAPDVKRMYDDFYNFLSSTGIDSVKTDAQFFLDEIDTAPARRSLTSTYINAWTSAQLRHFQGHAISCMSQAPQIIFTQQLVSNGPAICVRISDDFFPNVDESHPWHIFCNAHTALLAQHLNVMPDWDMFQTYQKWGNFHAAARAISGGPIYITDTPGLHDVSLIQQMTATTSLGQTVILRPSVVGRSVEAYIGFDEERFLQVQAYDGASNTGSAFLGLWNCRPNPIAELVPMTNFMGVQEAQDYILINHRTGICTAIVMGEGKVPLIAVTIEGHEWALFTLRPVNGPCQFSKDKYISIANLGLLGKMTGAAAIVRHKIEARPFVSPGPNDATSIKNRVKITTSLKALGTLGLWVSNLDEVDLKSTMVMINGAVAPFHCVSKSEINPLVIEIDVEGAWKELELKPGWSNEVDVDVYIEEPSSGN